MAGSKNKHPVSVGLLLGLLTATTAAGSAAMAAPAPRCRAAPNLNGTSVCRQHKGADALPRPSSTCSSLLRISFRAGQHGAGCNHGVNGHLSLATANDARGAERSHHSNSSSTPCPAPPVFFHSGIASWCITEPRHCA